jgi:hypothetical protein
MIDKSLGKIRLESITLSITELSLIKGGFYICAERQGPIQPCGPHYEEVIITGNDDNVFIGQLLLPGFERIEEDQIVELSFTFSLMGVEPLVEYLGIKKRSIKDITTQEKISNLNYTDNSVFLHALENEQEINDRMMNAYYQEIMVTEPITENRAYQISRLEEIRAQNIRAAQERLLTWAPMGSGMTPDSAELLIQQFQERYHSIDFSQITSRVEYDFLRHEFRLINSERDRTETDANSD